MFRHHRFAARIAVTLLALASSSAVIAAPLIAVSGAWIRPATTGAGGAAYLTIINRAGVADILVAVSSPDATRASIHESRMVGQVMTMRALPNLAIRAGGEARFSPSGLHVMIEGLKHPLRPGGRLTLVLTFARSGLVRVAVPVRADAPAVPMAGMKM